MVDVQRVYLFGYSMGGTAGIYAAVLDQRAKMVQPQLDRDVTPADVHAAVEQAKKVYGLYGATDRLAL